MTGPRCECPRCGCLLAADAGRCEWCDTIALARAWRRAGAVCARVALIAAAVVGAGLSMEAHTRPVGLALIVVSVLGGIACIMR